MNIVPSIQDLAGYFCDFLIYSLSYPVLHTTTWMWEVE